jgi:putative ABC transport system permease protein
MKYIDLLKTSQMNLVRAKLRTALTVGAVFIGVLTISLTNGVGSGVREYVDSQLGNVGAEHTLFIQAKQSQQNPVTNEVSVYDPNRKIGNFNLALLGDDDAAVVGTLAGITKVTPWRDAHIEYITTGGQRYQATVTQYIEGLNIDMAAGATITPGSAYEITLPIRYIEPLGLGSAEQAIGATVTLAYKDGTGTIHEQKVTVVGVQERSLMGGADSNISPHLADQMYDAQTSGVATLANRYPAITVQYDANLSEQQVTDLKKDLDGRGYSAQTLEDQIGVISKVINTVLLILNMFGIIALLAATFGIVNTLLMAVNERTSEIGLMKALGADRRTIFALFAAEAVSIGFWGGLLGIGVSMVIGAVANHMAADTFLKDLVGLKILSFPFFSSFTTLLGVMVLAFLAGALPALKASKMDPISALRYE